ncbi:MAG: bifunctional serine/threonine-protein kinase/formylglycine-generating enzyme family protein [Myxococcota bacterium]
MPNRTAASTRGPLDATVADAPHTSAPDRSSRTDLPVLTPRYLDLGVLGTGGMAVVHRVQDQLLDRRVAMKVLATRLASDPTTRARFLREARLLAALRHPGIVPVHDLGELPDGRPFFTMDEVRGRSLGEVLNEGSASLTGRITVLGRVCACVAYAHTMGVLHRDLKPGNVMLGEEGEVRVVDWGIARAGAVGVHGGTDSAAMPAEHAPEDHTRFGAITGTPAYMAPEQAAGDPAAVGPHSDVYALGALLYTLLAGRPPYRGRDPRQVLAGPPPSVRDVAGEAVPDALVELCERAMARKPDDRPTAAGFEEAVEAWLAGAQRVANARASLAAAAERVPDAEAARAVADQARRAWMARDAVHPLGATDKVNAAHWEADNEAVDVDVRATLLEEEVVRALRGALAEAPDLPEAREALADRLLVALRAAEDHYDTDAAGAIAEELREQVAALAPTGPARARLETGLDGGGTLTLTTDPPGAEVWAARFEERHRRLVEVPAGTLGATPLRDVALPMGSWMLTVRAPGCADVRLPVHLRRGERWARVAPGEAAPRTLRLPRIGELGPDDCYVPAGWFVERRPDAAAAWPALRGWTEAFVMRRFPVTNREYLAFVNDLWATGRREEALAHVPCRVNGGPVVGYALDGDRFVLCPDPAGDVWDPDSGVMLVRPRDGTDLGAWLATRTGLPWRLPTYAEWTHAARGADGRHFPMGDHMDPAWAFVKGSYPAPPGYLPVDTFATDVSPFGVRGLTGGTVDFVEDRGPDGPAYAMRGGAGTWVPTASRLFGAHRPESAEARSVWHGFRLARSIA